MYFEQRWVDQKNCTCQCWVFGKCELLLSNVSYGHRGITDILSIKHCSTTVLLFARFLTLYWVRTLLSMSVRWTTWWRSCRLVRTTSGCRKSVTRISRATGNHVFKKDRYDLVPLRHACSKPGEREREREGERGSKCVVEMVLGCMGACVCEREREREREREWVLARSAWLVRVGEGKVVKSAGAVLPERKWTCVISVLVSTTTSQREWVRLTLPCESPSKATS